MINLKILIVTELILLLFVVWLILNFSIAFFILFCTKEFVKILLYSCIIVLFLEIVLGWNKYVLLDRLILEILYKYVINDKNFYISRVQLKKILLILNNKWLCNISSNFYQWNNIILKRWNQYFNTFYLHSCIRADFSFYYQLFCFKKYPQMKLHSKDNKMKWKLEDFI